MRKSQHVSEAVPRGICYIHTFIMKRFSFKRFMENIFED